MTEYSVSESKSIKSASRALRAWQVFGTFCFLVTLGLFVGLLIVISEADKAERVKSKDNDEVTLCDCQQKCTMGTEVTPGDLQNPSVFQDLSESEILAIRGYLHSVVSLNLKDVSEAEVMSSYLYAIELNVPLKAEVLEYLDRNGDKPKRTARAVVIRGDTDPPMVEEFIVGPFPNPSWHKPANNTGYNRYPIPFNRRPQTKPEYRAGLNPIVDKAAEDLYELLMESYGAAVHNCTSDTKCMFFDISSQLNLEGQGRKSWYVAFRSIEGFHLHPLGTEILVSHNGNNISTWQVEKVVYYGQMFDSVEKLMVNYRAGNVTKLKLPFPENDENLYSSFRRKGEDVMKVLRRGPRMYEPDGHRYTVTGQHVDYMGWMFDFRMRPLNAMQMFDIRFKGDRIAYEISVQEFAAFYTGMGPNQVSTRYLDTAYVLYNFELTQGVDCPHSATYLDTYAFYNTDEPFHRKNSVCIFEYDSGVPLMRHYANDYSGSYEFYGGINGYALTVRSIVSVYNYDYIVDFLFYNNGVLQVRESATGYVMANFGLPQELSGYAFPIADHVTGNMHHHIFNYKVDLDIKGEKNRFATLDITPETIPHPWFPGYNVTQARFDEILRETEMEAAIKYNFDEPRYYVVYSQNSTNKLGSKRGYRIENAGMSKFVLPDQGDTRVVRWAKYQLAVSKYKPDEPSSSCIYTITEKYDPIIDFDSFITDDESIVDEDLVLWVSMGTHHIPVTEDIPSTFTTGGAKSFYLRPFNYFDECPTVSSRDTVYILPEEDGQANVNTYGQEYQANCQPKEKPFTYDGRYGK